MDLMDLDQDSATTKHGAVVEKSIEGYILMLTNLHEETTEDDLLDILEEYGKVTNLHLNLDRQSGYCSGYALAEFETLNECSLVLANSREGEGLNVLGKRLDVDFAFTKEPTRARIRRTVGRNRSRSHVTNVSGD